MSSSDYTSALEQGIAQAMLEVIAEKNPKHARFLQQVVAIGQRDSSDKEAAYEALWCSIEKAEAEEFIIELVQLEAKIVDMQFRARTSGGITCLEAVLSFTDNKKMVHTGDTFYEVIGRCAHVNLHKSIVQELVDGMVTWPSLTTHPTNPTSVKYTAAALVVQNLMADPQTTREQLFQALRKVRDTEMDEQVNAAKQRKKTPQMEIEELLLIMDGIYDAVPIPSQRLRQALDAHGYNGVIINRNPLLDLNVWGPGDGDGNPNMTADLLESCVHQFRDRIKNRYLEDLTAIHTSPDTPPQLKEQLSYFIRGYSLDAQSIAQLLSPHPEALSLQFIKRMAKAYPNVPGVRELETRFKTFQNSFAKIDVRHNSRDVTYTIACVLVATGYLESVGHYILLEPEQQAELLIDQFSDEKFFQAASHLRIADLESIGKDAKVATRIMERVRVMAKYKDMFGKFIIAEASTRADALAALMLLKLGGCEIATPQATIDVVPLFESRSDLVSAPFVVHSLASEGLFSDHLRARGHFLVMIAKSDTARLSGPGVQGQQEETYGKLLAMNTKCYKGIQMFVMLGGGHDQMRGGGRIVESPHVILRASAREGGKTPTKIAMTVQGQQMQLVFGTAPATAHFIEAFSSQAFLANGRIQGILPWRHVPGHLNEIAAERQAIDFFSKAMDNYEAAIGGYDPQTKKPNDARKTIIEYFAAFPATIIEITNKSSRPGARTKTIDPLEGRAISLDQRSKHDGSYITATIGVADALEYLLSMIRTGGPDELSLPKYAPMTAVRHCYLANKSFRDFVRMQATDYSNAWGLRGGIPSGEEREALQRAFHPGGFNHPRVFLAKIQERDHREASILAHAITGCPIPSFISLKAPLEAGWPAVAKKMAIREAESQFSKIVERQMAFKLSWSSQLPPNIENLKRIAYYAYCGANPAYTTPSFSMTMTDPYKEGKETLDQDVSLPLPSWVTPAPKL